MRGALYACAVGVALVVGAIGPRTAAADPGPSNKCYGEIIAGIAATWPWAHDEKVDFAPPPGAIALWIKSFGPGLGISSVRELQVLFCGD